MKVVGLLLLVPILSLFIFIYLSLPHSPPSTTNTNFVVNKGDSLKIIASRLESNQLIKNRYIFLLNAYILKLHQKLQAGSFQISPSDSNQEIIQKLTQGGRFDVWFKIIDGQRNEEIVNALPDFIDPKAFLIQSQDKIGQLYPDSYLIPIDTSLDQFFTIIETNFQKKLSTIKSSNTSTLTDQQTIVLASLIEREARTLASKQMVAGILLNRLQIGMPLQVDATAQYARDSQLPRPKEYWRPVAKKDLAIDSPFNTYKISGLPPSAICNPGYDSLYAVYHPTSSDYLFYITGNDNLMHYATTLDQHNSNIAKYLR